MTPGSRGNLMSQAAGVLQRTYERSRAAARAGFEQLADQGAFLAPFRPTHAPQGELGLPEPLRLDGHLAEAG
jgi:hypothetical protein